MAKIGVIGLGNMAEALIVGWLSASCLKPRDILGLEVSSPRARLIKKKYLVSLAKNLPELAQECRVILLAVKPQALPALLQELYPLLTQNHLLLSIAAGVSTTTLGQRRKIIRLMPNTPASIGSAMTAFFATKPVTQAERVFVQKIFSAVGLVLEVKNEGQLDAITGLSGSGPAYVYYLLSALIRGGQKVGLSKQQARQLSVQTLLGATKLFASQDESAETLIQKVASKGGTTDAGLAVLKSQHVDQSLIDCVQAATQRALVLRKQAEGTFRGKNKEQLG